MKGDNEEWKSLVGGDTYREKYPKEDKAYDTSGGENDWIQLQAKDTMKVMKCTHEVNGSKSSMKLEIYVLEIQTSIEQWRRTYIALNEDGPIKP